MARIITLHNVSVAHETMGLSVFIHAHILAKTPQLEKSVIFQSPCKELLAGRHAKNISVVDK